MYNLYNVEILDPEDIMLTEEDIDHPYIHVDLCKLPNYNRDHLITWLKYRGDTLKHLDSMKEIRNRYMIVIHHFFISFYQIIFIKVFIRHTKIVQV